MSILAILLVVASAKSVSAGGNDNALRLDDFKNLANWQIEGAKEVSAVEDPKGGACLRWRSVSRDSTAMVKDLTPLKDQLAGCDAICFEYWMDGEPSQAWMTLENVPGFATARNWYFKFSSRYKQVWRTARFELRLDDDSPDNGKDPRTLLRLSFAGWKTGPNATYEWRVKNLRAVRYTVTLDYDETVKGFEKDGDAYRYRYDLKIHNRDNVERECALVFDRQRLKHFTLVSEEEPFMVKAGAEKVVVAILSIPAEVASKLEPLYTEEAPVILRVKGLAETDTTVLRGWQELPVFGAVPPRYAGADRPRVRCDAARLTALREWCAQEPDFVAARASLVENAENFLKPRVVLPETSGGYDQGFVCPKCSTGFATAPLTEEMLTQLYCPTCKEWIRGNRNLREKVVTEFHRLNANMSYECALAFALTGEKKYADRAKEILLGYARIAPRMKLVNAQATGYNNLLGWCVLGESYLCSGFPWAYDFLLAGHCLTETEQQEIETNFLLPLMKRLSLHNGQYSNQTAEYRSNQLAIALACGHWVMAGRALNWDFGFHELVEYGFDADGWTIEGSEGYQRGHADCLDEIAEAAHYAGADVYRRGKFEKLLKLAGLRHVLFARYQTPYPDEAGRVRPTAIFSQSEANYHSNERWFFCSPRAKTDLAVAKAREKEASSIQEGTGYTFVRFGEPKTFNGIDVNWGQTWERNAHDLFSHKLYLRGQRADSRAGRISYSHPQASFTSASLAASGIVVDEADSSMSRQLSCLVDGGNRFSAGIVAADPQRPLYPGVEIVRYFVARPEGVLLVDVIKSDAPHNVDWPFYPPGKVETSLANMKLVDWKGAKGPGYDVPHDLSGTVTDGAFTFQWPLASFKAQRTVAGGEPKEVMIGTAYATWAGTPIPFSLMRKRQVKQTVNVEFFEAFDQAPALSGLSYAVKNADVAVTMKFASGKTKAMLLRAPRIQDGKLLPPQNGACVVESD
ncbi:MAG: hypothetical protein HY360_15190 [Verrucomicrobia bacterium]|nr:hypothetical protein [Verrucomicrobiota bacterium]